MKLKNFFQNFGIKILFFFFIEKDVARTDRTHKFFQGENNAHVHMLFDILMTYCMYNFDLGKKVFPFFYSIK